MATTTAQKKAILKYQKKTYKRINYLIRKENFEKFQYWVHKTNNSKNGFITKAIETYIGMLEKSGNENDS